MALEHVIGKTLATGTFDLSNQGLEGQSGSQAAGGELKTYRNKDGEICSLYAVDADESDLTFEGLMKTGSYMAMDVGDEITIAGYPAPTGGKWLVEEWDEVYQNDEVTKVRGKAHLYICEQTQQG